MEGKGCCWKEKVFDWPYAGPNPAAWDCTNSYWQEISLNGIVQSVFSENERYEWEELCYISVKKKKD